MRRRSPRGLLPVRVVVLIVVLRKVVQLLLLLLLMNTWVKVTWPRWWHLPAGDNVLVDVRPCREVRRVGLLEALLVCARSTIGIPRVGCGVERSRRHASCGPGRT